MKIMYYQNFHKSSTCMLSFKYMSCLQGPKRTGYVRQFSSCIGIITENICSMASTSKPTIVCKMLPIQEELIIVNMEDVTQNLIHEDKTHKSFAFLCQLTI